MLSLIVFVCVLCGFLLLQTVGFNDVDGSAERLGQSPGAKRARVSEKEGTCAARVVNIGNAPGSCYSGGGSFCAAPAPASASASARNCEGGVIEDGGDDGLLNSSRKGDCECAQAFEWTEQGLCLKCNEGGQVLICGTGDCPLAVHECCLSYTPSFDDEGKYYCPLCSYKQVVSELDEIQKELASAKEKAHVARDLLCVFISGHVEKQTIQMKEHCESVEVGGEELSAAVIDRQEAVDACGRINEILRVDTSLLSKGVGASRTTGERAEEISSLKQKSKVDQQEAGTAADSPSNSHENERCGILRGVASHSKRGESSWNRSTVDQQNAAATGVLIPNRGTQGKAESSRAINSRDKSLEQVSDIIESSEDEDLHNAPISKSVKSNKPASRSTNPAIPNSKRKKLVWTEEEEKMLKEAVEKCSHAGKNIPWKSILAFGSQVFNASRTPVDLKDKWRNMFKANSRGR